MKIKNLSLLAIAVLLSAGVAQAQKVSKSDDSIEFRPHWIIQLMGGAGYTIGEANYMQLFSPAAALNLGWQITPSFGLRLGASGLQGKGHAVHGSKIVLHLTKDTPANGEPDRQSVHLDGGNITRHPLRLPGYRALPARFSLSRPESVCIFSTNLSLLLDS